MVNIIAMNYIFLGTLNFLNDQKGVKSAYCYGNSYFCFKYSIRERTTITDRDSDDECIIGTLSHCLQVLNTLTDKELE